MMEMYFTIESDVKLYFLGHAPSAIVKKLKEKNSNNNNEVHKIGANM